MKEVISDLCIEVICTMRVIGLIRNFFFEEVLGLVSRYSRTLLLNCCSQHFLFIVEILINERIRISVYDVSNIHILLCSELVNEG